MVNSLNLTKETKEIVKASLQTKILELQEDGFKTIYLVLMKWCKFLGIKEAPDAEHMTDILYFIKKHFGDLTAQEVSTAFELAVAKKLAVDPNHYQNFSPLYVGGILDAYKNYRGEHIKAYRDRLSEHQEKVASEKNRPSDDELKALRLESLLKIWDDFAYGEDEEPSWQVHVYYDILNDAGLIDLSKEEKETILNRAKALCKDEANKTLQNEFKRNRIIQEINQHSAKTPSEKVLQRCKLLVATKIFEKLVADGVDLREHLNLPDNDRFAASRERGQEASPVEQV